MKSQYTTIIINTHPTIQFPIVFHSKTINQKTMNPKTLIITLLLTLFSHSDSQSNSVCIIGTGIGGASVAHFLRSYSSNQINQIRLFERNGIVGGRMATVTIGNETFEAGASILHPKNYHVRNYTELLGLKRKEPKESDDSLDLGIWNGREFVFKTIKVDSKWRIVGWVLEIVNSVRIGLRYGLSLFRMSSLVEETVDNFVKYYEDIDSRPVFESVEEMLKWAGLYNLTTQTLGEKLAEIDLSSVLIRELVTVITRINYGQSVNISGLAGAVSLAGSGGGLWAVEGGNWQMAAGLINRSDVSLHLHEEIKSVSYIGDAYELNTTEGKSYSCQVTVVATPLDELNIQFTPEISIPPRKLQHTFTTFVRGLLNPAYFGMKKHSDIPDLVGTTETDDVPFSCISVLKKHESDMTFKLFSRKPLADTLLDDIFSVRVETIKIDWAAYPHYEAPEEFAPFMLDDKHLYYVNAFENAASTMETSAVSAENIARLILSRLSDQNKVRFTKLKNVGNDSSERHLDL